MKKTALPCGHAMGTVSSYFGSRSGPHVWLPGMTPVAPFSAVNSSKAGGWVRGLRFIELQKTGRGSNQELWLFQMAIVDGACARIHRLGSGGVNKALFHSMQLCNLQTHHGACPGSSHPGLSGSYGTQKSYTPGRERNRSKQAHAGGREICQTLSSCVTHNAVSQSINIIVTS